MSAPRGLVVFDLEGTLLRGPTIAQLLASELGAKRPALAEQAATRRELAIQRTLVARRLALLPRHRLVAALQKATFAPHAEQAVMLLRRRSIECAIASSSCDIAVEWLASRLGIEHTLATGVGSSGTITHVWPDDLAEYPQRLAAQLGIPLTRTAVVSQPASGLLQTTVDLALRWA